MKNEKLILYIIPPDPIHPSIIVTRGHVVDRQSEERSGDEGARMTLGHAHDDAMNASPPLHVSVCLCTACSPPTVCP